MYVPHVFCTKIAMPLLNLCFRIINYDARMGQKVSVGSVVNLEGKNTLSKSGQYRFQALNHIIYYPTNFDDIVATNICEANSSHLYTSRDDGSHPMLNSRTIDRGKEVYYNQHSYCLIFI
jgi:hypothetical protein